ncbi:MAG: hypothetical protein ACE5HS_04420 [bacterium]
MKWLFPVILYLSVPMGLLHFIVVPDNTFCQEKTSPRPALNTGAWELGFSGTLTVQEGLANAALSIRGGRFLLPVLSGLGGLELELAYAHVRALDLLDMQCTVTWQRALGRSTAHLFLALGGGIRQEWLGSFRQRRVPAGFALGIRTLFGQKVGMRTEYQFRRIFNDPVAAFTEHKLVVGLSLFIHNRNN